MEVLVADAPDRPAVVDVEVISMAAIGPSRHPVSRCPTTVAVVLRPVSWIRWSFSALRLISSVSALEVVIPRATIAASAVARALRSCSAAALRSRWVRSASSSSPSYMRRANGFITRSTAYSPAFSRRATSRSTRACRPHAPECAS